MLFSPLTSLLPLSPLPSPSPQTKVAKNAHRNPTFEQSYIFNLEGKEELLHCNVWHEGTLGDGTRRERAFQLRGGRTRRKIMAHTRARELISSFFVSS